MTETPPAPGSPPGEHDAAGAALEEAVGLAFRVLKGVMLLLVVLFLGSGFFTVGSHQVGYVRHLGVLDTAPLQPGLHWGWPVVDDQVCVDKRPITYEVETFDLYRTKLERLEDKPLERRDGIDPRKDGYLVTGDTSLVHVSLSARAAVQAPYYRAGITVHDPQALLTVLLERAATRVAAGQEIDSLLGAGKSSFLKGVKQELQASLDRTEAGYRIEGVDLLRSLTVPPQTREAFGDVTKAEQKADQIRSEAGGDAARIKKEGQVEAARIKTKARNRATRIVKGAEADVDRFDALLPTLAEDPLGEKRRGLKARELARVLSEALDRVNEVFLISEGELRIRLERDVRKKREEAFEQVGGGR